MGACCQASEQSSELIDLPQPSFNRNDMIEVNESQLCHRRCTMKAYMTKLNEAHTASGWEGYVRLEDLKAAFNRGIWAEDLQKSSSVTMNYIENFCSRDEGLDYVSLVVMGMLFCVDQKKPKEKAMAFFAILQDSKPGDENNQASISAQDKDWKPIVDKILEIAANSPIDASDDLKELYQDDRDNLVSKFDDVSGWDEAGDGETTIIDTIFAVQSRVSY